MSILSVDTIQPIGSGSTVTLNAAKIVVGTGITFESNGQAIYAGIITATSFSGTASNASGATGDFSIADKIVHDGDTNTSLRFPAADTITAETGGSERLRIDSTGDIGLGESNPNRSGYASPVVSIGYNTSNNYSVLELLGNKTSDANISTIVGYNVGGSSRIASMSFARSGANNSGAILFETYSSGSAAERLRIHSTGAVTKPNHPVFIAYRVNSYNIGTSAAVLLYDYEHIDVGGNYNPSNGRFTAPVTGLYEFAYAAIAGNTATIYRYDLRLNGSFITGSGGGMRLELRIDQSQSGSEYGTNGEYVCYVNMTAGQYAQVYVHADNTVNTVYGSTSYGYTYFRGRLVG